MGSNYACLLRKVGAIPGVIFGLNESGKDESIPIAMPLNEIIRYFNYYNFSLHSTVFNVYLEGKKIVALPSQLHVDPGMRKIIFSY